MSNKKAVLSHTGRYISPDEIDDKEPYYYSQGIGSLTSQSTSINVTYNGLQVSYNGESVINT